MRLDHSEIALWFTLVHPLTFCDFMGPKLIMSDWEFRPPWKTQFSQKPIICDQSPQKLGCTGRGTGKTCRIQLKVAYDILTGVLRSINPSDSVLITAERTDQIIKLFIPIAQFTHTDPLISHLYPMGTKNEKQFHFSNGFKLFFEWAGSTDPAKKNLRKHHVRTCIIDEAGQWTWASDEALQPMIRGAELVIYGVMDSPDRTAPLFRWAHDSKDPRSAIFENHRYSEASFFNGAEPYTVDDFKREVANFGGSIEDDKFRRHVVGEIGAVAEGAYDPKRIALVTNAILALPSAIGGRCRYATTYLNAADNLDPTRIYSVYLPTPRGPAVLGHDEGEKISVSIVFVWLDPGVDVDDGMLFPMGRWRMVHQVVCRNFKPGVNPNLNADIVNTLDRLYDCDDIGMDVTGGHTSLQTALTVNPIYAARNYREKLFPVNFASKSDVSLHEEPPPMPEGRRPEERTVGGRKFYVVTKNTYQHSLDIGRELIGNMKIEFPANQDFIKELTSIPAEGFEKRRHVRDHSHQAWQCAVATIYARHMLQVPKRKRRIKRRDPFRKGPIVFDVRKMVTGEK